MASKNGQLIAVLRRLLAACLDGEEGYCAAATDVEDNHLRILFSAYCQQRGQLAGELQRLILKLGGEIDALTGIMGNVHRGWNNARLPSTGSDDMAVLGACQRADEAILEEYEEALKLQLPPLVRQVVHRQFFAIRAARDRMRELQQVQSKVS